MSSKVSRCTCRTHLLACNAPCSSRAVPKGVWRGETAVTTEYAVVCAASSSQNHSLLFLFSSVLIIPPLHSLVLPTSEQTVGVINVAIVASAHTLRRALAGMCGDDGHAAIVCGLTQYIYIVLSFFGGEVKGVEKNIGIIFTRSTFTCCANGHITAQSSCTSSDNQVDLLQSSARHFFGGI